MASAPKMRKLKLIPATVGSSFSSGNMVIATISRNRSTTVVLDWEKMERTEIGAALTEGLCSNPMCLSIIEAT
jgi:hypothetical protein